MLYCALQTGVIWRAQQGWPESAELQQRPVLDLHSKRGEVCVLALITHIARGSKQDDGGAQAEEAEACRAAACAWTCPGALHHPQRTSPAGLTAATARHHLPTRAMILPQLPFATSTLMQTTTAFGPSCTDTISTKSCTETATTTATAFNPP